jgi:serine/threonine protein kinase/tetratricopeptide (TPR) repeat protein
VTPQPQASRSRAILEAALKRRQSERIAFIDGACAGNEPLRAEVISLLDSHDSPASVPPPPADEEDDAPTRIAPRSKTPAWRPGQPMEGRRIGPYQLLHSLGKGGMGSVYAASRADQEYKKIVAIKLVTSGLDSEEMLRRFRNERQVLAGLDHPCIARLLDGGSTDDGLPYLVMEFVEGLPIDRYCETHHLSLTDRLKLFQKVCSAVQYAHQNLVVHRDIKPGNILVGNNGEPKLLDFGIAKLMTAEFSVEEIELNRGEAQPMTLRYASPEQVRGEPITTESDIYSLGVLLYELLAGEHPFQSALTSRSSIEKAILTQAPEPPSVVVLRRAENESDPKLKHAGKKLARRLTGDIDPILITALVKQPRGRYPSAESFSLDITRYLNGFPVSPRRDEFKYRARKFVHRHAISVVAAALVAVALVVGSVVTWQSAQTARAERAKAQGRFEDVRKLARFVLFDFDDKIKAGPTAARKVVVTEALKYLDGLAKDTSGDASLGRELIEGYLKVGDLQGNPNGPNLGDSTGAKESYSKALQLAEELRAKYPRDAQLHLALAQVHMKLGDLSEYSGNKDDALKRYQQAREIVQPLAGADEKAKRSLMLTSGQIGTTQLQLGDTNGALENYGRYLQIAQELLAAHRNDPDARHDAALGYDRMGETMAKTGAISEGLQKLKVARSIYEELAASSPQSPARRDVASVDMVMGDILKTAHKNDEAVDSFRQALKITETLAAEDPKNTEYKRDLHITLGRLADALYAAGKQPEARRTTEQALQVLRPMVDAPGASDYEIYQYCWLLLTTPFRDLRAPSLARHYAEQLVQSTAGKDPNTLDLLARAFAGGGDYSRAVDTEAKALSLLPSGSASDLRTELEKNLSSFRVGKQP